jgi:hypothetical protein
MVLPRKHHVNVPCQHVDMVLSRSDSLTPRKHHVNTLLQNLGRGVERMVRCLWNCVKMHVPMPPVLPPPPPIPGPTAVCGRGETRNQVCEVGREGCGVGLTKVSRVSALVYLLHKRYKSVP